MEQVFCKRQNQRRYLYYLLIALGLALLTIQSLRATTPHIAHLTVDGAIGPATTDYLSRSLAKARQQGAQIAIIELDTPGGLVSSTSDITRLFLQSEIPIATFVSPEGARAASAGTFIVYASHIAAMHPATRIGAATPVQMQGRLAIANTEPLANEAARTSVASDSPTDSNQQALERKILNDTIAMIRQLAEHHGRNAEWAEQAVREAATLTAREALDEGVIELVVSNINDLVSDIHGRTVTMQNGELEIQSVGLSVTRYEPDLRNRILNFLTNPQLAYLLLLVGVYGIIFELMSPGTLVPGVTGVIALLLAAFSLQILPINTVGLLLIILGAGMLVIEFFLPSFGVVGVGGVVALAAGSLMLFDTTIPGMELPMSIIASVVFVALGCVAFVVLVMARSGMRTRKPSDREVLGLTGKVVENLNPQGYVQLGREIWPAQARNPHLITFGKLVRVVAQEGTLVYVDEIKKTEQRPARSSIFRR